MNAKNVSTGKPKVTGAIFSAPVGTTLPTDAVTELDSAFVQHGYASEDGITNNNTKESEDIKAWGGDIVLNVQTGKTDTFAFTLIETMNRDNLVVVYGNENVSGNIEDGITVKANAKEQEVRSWVIDMILRDAIKRIVIPEASISELGEIQYNDSSAIGYAITLTATPDEAGNTHYEYIKSTVTRGYARLSSLSLGSLSLTPSFDIEITRYETSTENATNTVTATAAEGISISLNLNGSEIENGSPASWNEGENNLEITASAEGRISTVYVITVSKS